MTENSMFNKIKRFFEGRTKEESAYILATIFILLSFFTDKFNKEYASVFLVIATFFLYYGFFFAYLIPLIQRIWESYIVKISVSGLVFLGSTFSLSLAKIAINETFHVPASPFAHTQALLSILLAPLVIAAIFLIVNIFLSPIFIFYFLNKNKTVSLEQLFIPWKDDKVTPENSCVSCLRIAAYLIFIFFIFNFITNSGWYVDTIMKSAKWYAHIFETERFSYCKLDKNERVAYIGDDNIVVATKENGVISFKMAKCVNANEK